MAMHIVRDAEGVLLFADSGEYLFTKLEENHYLIIDSEIGTIMGRLEWNGRDGEWVLYDVAAKLYQSQVEVIVWFMKEVLVEVS